MAEVLATMVVGPLVSMVRDKASSYLLDQYNVMDGMEDQHKLLKRKLPAVMDVVTDAEEQAAKNREGAKAWLEELRKVAYKANDVLDEFKYEALRRKAKAEGHYKEFGMDVIKLFPSHNRFVFRYKMAKKLCMILQEIDVLIAEMNTFRFKFKPQPSMSMKWRETDHNIPDHFVNIASLSRATEKDEIVAELCGQRENMVLTVLPIVGMGGMGKTTLAQLVYNDSVIQKHFQVRLWVCVSENFDVDSLVEIIWKEAKKNGCQENGNTTLEKLRSALSGKRYLLVLDDVWNRDDSKWRKLRSYLQHGGTGSSVVTTTRDKHVAKIMGTINKTHEIKGLDSNIIEEIIKTGAFGSQAEVPTEFKILLGHIANKCKGSPLAATALGSVLRTKNSVEEWKALSSRNTICDDENGILPILKLSYNCLPPHMRQCFAFCAMFPKDHEIDVEMLIRLWMANSFIPEKQGVCLEVTGKQIFHELAERSFFQEVKQVRSDASKNPEEQSYCARTTCKIHDLMHDVAQDSMGKECVSICTVLSESEDFPYTARHLFLSVDIAKKDLKPSLEKESPAIQTLICERSTTDDLQHLLPECRSIRAIKTRLASRSFDFITGKGSPRQKRGVCFLCHTFGEKQRRHETEDMSPSHPDLAAPSLCRCQMFSALFKRRTFGVKRLQNALACRGEVCGMRQAWNATKRTLRCGSCGVARRGGEANQMRPETSAMHLAQLQLWCGARRRRPNKPSFLEPKYLHHLRYLDLSGSSDLKKIPEEITILYHLQTLDLSDCWRLEQLPMALKYMTALRHLYTHGCSSLKGMPPDLRCLTSLQTLTCFVAGDIGSGCSNIGELKKLDLGGQLELRHLENVTGADAKAANLRDKRKLEELELSWTLDTTDREEEAHKEVLDGLKPHDGIKALRMVCYGGRTFPKWMLELTGMVELKLCNCINLEKLPALWVLPALQFLYLEKLENLHCLFSGGPPSKFQKLEIMVLGRMPKFVTWWDTKEVQEEEPLFPKLEYLRIWDCFSLEALAKASTFPALRKIYLHELDKLQRWEAVEGEEEVTFPSLEDLDIFGCPELIDFPKARKLSKLSLKGNCSQEASVQAAGRYITSLSNMEVFLDTHGAENIKQNWKEVEVCGQESLMEVLELRGCHVFFSHSRALEVWKCFGKLACLGIVGCNDLVSWPENLFRGLVSLRTLEIESCPRLTGVITKEEASTSNEQSAAPEQSGGPLLPCLESLEMLNCANLEQVPNIWACPLKKLRIGGCGRLRSMVFGQQEDRMRPVAVSGEGAAQPADTSSSSLIVPVSASTDIHSCFFPYIESLEIISCGALTEVNNLPPSIKTLAIYDCGSLVSLSGKVSSLEKLMIVSCKSLQSLPDGTYSSLRVLTIIGCESAELLLPRNRLRSMVFSEQQDCTRLLSGEGAAQPADTTTSLLVPVSTSADNHHCFFPCLEYLEISTRCDALSEVADLPASIKTLTILECENLESLSGEFPSLEQLRIVSCGRLQSLPNGPYTAASWAHLDEKELDSPHRQVSNRTPDQGEFDSEPESKSMSDRERTEHVEINSKPESMPDGASTDVVLKQSSSPASSNRCFFPCLESLGIEDCGGLTEVPNLPRSIKTLVISNCTSFVSLPAEVPWLEELYIESCGSLKFLPDGPAHQAYSSLRFLKILDCGGIKKLPLSLQRRLNHIEEKDLDPRLLQGRMAALMSKLECFRSTR